MTEIIIAIIVALCLISITAIICYTNYKLSNNKTFERLYNLIHNQNVRLYDMTAAQQKYFEGLKYLENIT